MSPRRPIAPDSAPGDPSVALRVVFFGPPYSGKSALMSAFVKVASADAEEAPFDLVLMPSGPPNLSQDVIRREVKVDLPDALYGPLKLITIDCDGQAAGSLLRDATALTRPKIRSELLDEIRSADALIVTVDATDTMKEIEIQRADLLVFLKALRQGRAFGREVGGLPVFITLTKCDQLYQPGMTPDAWATAIKRQEDRVRGKFVEVLEDVADSIFGEITLQSAATAIAVPHQPAFQFLSDSDGHLHVDDLVHDVIDAAADYRKSQQLGKKRLRWTVSAALGLLGFMLMAFVGLALTGEPGPVEALTLRVRQIQAEEGPPEVRLADRNLARNRQQLEELRAAPHFTELPRELQHWATEREREFVEYAEYRKKFAPPQFSPAEVQTAEQLKRLSEDLNTTLAPPVEYLGEWSKTEAAQLRDKWAIDRELLILTEEQTHNWYRNLITRATTLMSVEVPSASWRGTVSELFEASLKPPFNPAEPIPGSPSVAVRRGQPLTYAAAVHFERTDLARQDWEFAQRKLADLRDLCDALGLTVNPESPTAPLDLPEPSADARASLPLGVERWRAIQERFPRAAASGSYWSASNFPDPVRQELARRSRTATETALRHVRRLILAEFQLNGRTDSPSDWPKLADGLLATPEMQDWSRLVELLMKCADQERSTSVLPVADLSAFVKKTSFEWNLTAIEVVLPTALLTESYAPSGKFTITIKPERGAARVTTFGPAKVAEQLPRGVRYRFPIESGTTPLMYRPGEVLSAEFPIKSGTVAYKMKWLNGGTATYQFDRLTREPVLEPVAGGVAFPATGVKLIWTPVKEAVTVPELLPSMK